MIRISPAGCAWPGRRAVLQLRSWSARSAGRCSAALTAGFGLSAPFVIYGVALLIAAAVVFFSLRHSSLARAGVRARGAGGDAADRACATGRTASALFSNFATGWSVFGLRIALVPLFIAEVLDRGPRMTGLALATFAVGNVVGGDAQWLPVRPDRPAHAADRRTVGCPGWRRSWSGSPTSLPLFLAGGVRGGRGVGHVHLAAAGRGRRHHRQQVARRHRGRDVSDDGRLRRDRRRRWRSARSRSTSPSAAASWSAGSSCWSPRSVWVFAPETRLRPSPSHAGPPLGPESAASCPDQRL